MTTKRKSPESRLYWQETELPNEEAKKMVLIAK